MIGKVCQKTKKGKFLLLLSLLRPKTFKFLRLGCWWEGVAAPVLRRFGKEREKFIIYNDLRDAVVAESEFDV